jgi:hypothetical protein
LLSARFDNELSGFNCPPPVHIPPSFFCPTPTAEDLLSSAVVAYVAPVAVEIDKFFVYI